MAAEDPTKPDKRAISERTLYEPRAALRRIQSALLALVLITAAGVFGYMVLEGWSFTDALYTTVITLTTVGYREVRELDTTGQLWTMVLLITGVGTLFYAAVSWVELAVEGTIRGYFGRRRMEAAISKLSGHYILCGYGRVGQQVAREFTLDRVPFVIIEQDPETVEECVEEGYLVLLGEASDDEVLGEAGIRRAKGLVAAVDSDASNVFVVLSARKLKPEALHRRPGQLRRERRQARDSWSRPHPLALRRWRREARLARDPASGSGLPRHRHAGGEGDRVQT
jgi:voltage-gated potassium channel